ncbi:peptidoglycan DD-metalloendopeptidase family protein [Sphingobium sp. AN641]|uniref:M23 family metallopeptidase n=1 Tax=Sphingobium sp. AN641 TaxID=3133443 RepID=UPI0030C4CB51
MLKKQQRRISACIAQMAARLLPEREIYLRSGKDIRFIRLTPRVQLLSLATLSFGLLGLGALALNVGADSAALARERAAIAAHGKAVASQAGQVDAYRRSVGALARELETRQDFMDDLYKTHFGDDAASEADLVDRADSDKDAAPVKTTRISAGPQATPLLRIEQRQQRFARTLTGAVERRAEKAAAAIRSFGLNPDMLARGAARAQGGPFVPWRGEAALSGDLKALAVALARMEFLERSLVAIPSGQPTATPMLSSSYGYRRDPFNGHAAFHSGIDFPGRHGQPILAAARGRISFVGQRQGYGNVVEVDHGNGLMTRYAHLSHAGSRVGQAVARGDAIGRMGSTGRSTGTHLHFEVRLNGEAINPRRFLQARKDVLQLQQIAKARFADIGGRG